MTRNDTPDKLEWSIRRCSGTDSAQWDQGINNRIYRASKLIIYMIAFVGHLNTSCPDGWYYGNYHCYMFSREVKTLSQAMDTCAGLHSKLITVDTLEEAVSNF